jgi:hypothetical protein
MLLLLYDICYFLLTLSFSLFSLKDMKCYNNLCYVLVYWQSTEYMDTSAALMQVIVNRWKPGFVYKVWFLSKYKWSQLYNNKKKSLN